MRVHSIYPTYHFMTERDFFNIDCQKVVVIKGHPDYFVSSLGVVYSAKSGNLVPLTPCNLTKGYKGVSISIGHRSVTKKIHRLVGEHFLDNPSNLPQLNHKDSDKSNNCSTNLEWCNNSYNIQHAYLAGRNPSMGNLSLTAETLNYIVSKRQQGVSLCKIGKLSGYSDTHISRILNNLSHYKTIAL